MRSKLGRKEEAFSGLSILTGHLSKIPSSFRKPGPALDLEIVLPPPPPSQSRVARGLIKAYRIKSLPLPLHTQYVGTIESLPSEDRGKAWQRCPAMCRRKVNRACVSSFNIIEARQTPDWDVEDDAVRFVLLPCGGEPLSPGGFSAACKASALFLLVI
jgi:hypothetical protein